MGTASAVRALFVRVLLAVDAGNAAVALGEPRPAL